MFNDALKKYSDKNPVRFHMPAHKGKIANGSRDVTELFFTDNLYSPDPDVGFTHQLEEKITRVFFESNDTLRREHTLRREPFSCASNKLKSKYSVVGKNTSRYTLRREHTLQQEHFDCVVSCGGATLAIQAAILFLVRYSKKNSQQFMLCDRNSHISLVNALALCGVEPIWFFSHSDIQKHLQSNKKDKNIIGIFVTSPDYYGKMHDISAISSLARAHSVPLIADNSHGSHLSFHNDGILHPLNCGADFSVDSLHKTLPVLTGGAVLHFKKIYKKDSVRSALRTFASTSPSFLILQSIESAVIDLEKNGVSTHASLLESIEKLRNAFPQLIAKQSSVADPFRIVLTPRNYGVSGRELYFYLAENNIFCEFYDDDNVIIIPSICNGEKDFPLLSTALKIFFGSKKITGNYSAQPASLPTPDTVLSLRQSVLSARETIPVADSLGRIAAESVAIYPPGTPLIIGGERISSQIMGIIGRIKQYIDVILQ